MTDVPEVGANPVPAVSSEAASSGAASAATVTGQGNAQSRSPRSPGERYVTRDQLDRVMAQAKKDFLKELEQTIGPLRDQLQQIRDVLVASGTSMPLNMDYVRAAQEILADPSVIRRASTEEMRFALASDRLEARATQENWLLDSVAADRTVVAAMAYNAIEAFASSPEGAAAGENIVRESLGRVQVIPHADLLTKDDMRQLLEMAIPNL